MEKGIKSKAQVKRLRWFALLRRQQRRKRANSAWERTYRPKAETSLLGIGDELQLFQRGEVITSAATYASGWWQDADLFVVAQSRWAHPSPACDRRNS